MKITSNIEEYIIELQDLSKLFGIFDSEIEIEHTETLDDGVYCQKFIITNDGNKNEYNYSYTIDKSFNALRQKSYRKRMVKNYLYSILSKMFNITLPWGSLTGVRPTKFARDLIENGEAKEHVIPEILARDYYVAEDKARIVGRILRNQKGIIRNDNLVDIYLNIPICPTRCLYCSFISSELKFVEDKVDDYIQCMIKEIDAVKDIIKEKSYIVRNMYMGGGTPSVLTAKQLDLLLSKLKFPVNE